MICDFLTPSKLCGENRVLEDLEFSDNLEICVTSVEPLGNDQDFSQVKNRFYSDLFLCYTQFLGNEDSNLYIPIEGNPNGLIEEELPKLLSNIKFGERIIGEKPKNKEKAIDYQELMTKTQKERCIQGLLGSWQLVNELSDDMELFLQNIGVGILKRKVVNKGNFTLKVNKLDEEKLVVKIEPFFGPSQIMNWDLSGNIFVETSPEVGVWRNQVEFIRLQHERTNNAQVIAINMTRKSENFPGKVIETRWTQEDPKHSKIKYIRYR
ncbi:fatty acid binding protein [Cryptosporidium felis]|nr:fatty acid binding protein [Cryptosporidium felis]